MLRSVEVGSLMPRCTVERGFVSGLRVGHMCILKGTKKQESVEGSFAAASLPVQLRVKVV